MSLERLYYNDPFSNIIISFDFHTLKSSNTIIDALKITIKSFESLEMSISADDNGRLLYKKVGYTKNIENIVISESDELNILKSLATHPFDLENGDTFLTIIQNKDFGYTIYFCMHHIIGDANSLILIIKEFIAVMQGKTISYEEDKNISADSTVELDTQIKYFITTINKQYPHKQYSKCDFLLMHNQIHGSNDLDITKITVNTDKFREIKEFCKKLDVSITSYIVSEVFETQDVELVCLPVNSRRTDNTFGNFVSRIDIPRKIAQSDKEHRLIEINKYIRNKLKDKDDVIKSEIILGLIDPGFYDDVIFDTYLHTSKSFAKKMSKLIGYKTDKPTTFVSNLKAVEFDCDSNSSITDLCFYPPHPAERFSTIGVVTYNNQMVITIQKFRKETIL